LLFRNIWTSFYLGGIICGGIFQGEYIRVEGSFWGEYSRGNFTRENFLELNYEILFICLNFSMATQFCAWKNCSMGIVQSNFRLGGDGLAGFSRILAFLEKIFCGKGRISGMI